MGRRDDIPTAGNFDDQERMPVVEALTRSLRSGHSRRVLLRCLGGVAVAVSAATRGRAMAQEATPAATPAAILGGSPVASPAAVETFPFALGDFALTAILDGALPIPGELLPMPPPQVLFVDAPPQELAAALRREGLTAWVEAPETVSIEAPFTPLLVDTGQNLVLLDTGVGPNAPVPNAGRLIAGLAAAGVEPGDVDTVVISHAHADHILGAIDAAGQPAFPNARYVMGRTEHAFWTDDARVAEIFPDEANRQQLLAPVQTVLPVIDSRLDLVDDAAESEIVPGLRAVAAHGHTPGHMAVLIESGEERLAATFDAFVHPLHVRYPAWNFAVDTLRNQTETTRRGLLDRAAADGWRLAVYHFPFPGLGRVAREEDAWRFTAEG